MEYFNFSFPTIHSLCWTFVAALISHFFAALSPIVPLVLCSLFVLLLLLFCVFSFAIVVAGFFSNDYFEAFGLVCAIICSRHKFFVAVFVANVLIIVVIIQFYYVAIRFFDDVVVVAAVRLLYHTFSTFDRFFSYASEQKRR